MKFAADLQLHSKYSRATSPQMVVENVAQWGKIKGIKVLGTGDFTHPAWFKELKEKLVPAEQGLFRYRDDLSQDPTRFMLTAETSHIYSKNNRVRKVHIVIWAPSFEAVERINTKLSRVGNLFSDGRPIMGLDSKELAKIVLEADENCMVIPAHAWTPWFSVFGSMSGFDSLEECFDEYTKYIYAIETGLSSDPPMNWRLSQLDRVALVSNSDSHSLPRLGREANVFDTELSYQAIIDAVKTKDPQKFLFTIEFFPEEGKYHYDGHRLCNISLAPAETKKNRGLCPVCGRSVTIGVLHRVEELADRPEGFALEGAIPFKSLVPLDEIIAGAHGTESKTKRVFADYHQLATAFGGEIPLLLGADPEEVARIANTKVAEGIRRVREGKLHIEPGYDGEYGKVKIFEEGEDAALPQPQKSLFGS